MYIVITEHNAWENERWKYLLDINKQDGGALNDLMIFIRLANEEFEKAKLASKYRLFAASRYTFKFYNEIENNGKYPRLINKKEKLSICSDPGYNSNSFDNETVLSSKRTRSAMLAIRDKKENLLYKRFDSLFLKSKKQKGRNIGNVCV